MKKGRGKLVAVDREEIYRRIDAGSVYLKPLNRQYPVMDMTGVKFKIVGRSC